MTVSFSLIFNHFIKLEVHNSTKQYLENHQKTQKGIYLKKKKEKKTLTATIESIILHSCYFQQNIEKNTSNQLKRKYLAQIIEKCKQ